jgi:hypothetical protein
MTLAALSAGPTLALVHRHESLGIQAGLFYRNEIALCHPRLRFAMPPFQHDNGSMLEKRLIAPKLFQSGQVWKLADSSLEIGLVGRMLVHYKHYKIKKQRTSTSLISKEKLEKFLNDNQAILVPE